MSNAAPCREPSIGLTDLCADELFRYRDVITTLLEIEEKYIRSMDLLCEKMCRWSPTASSKDMIFRVRQIGQLVIDNSFAKARRASLQQEAHAVAIALEPHGGLVAEPKLR